MAEVQNQIKQTFVRLRALDDPDEVETATKELPWLMRRIKSCGEDVFSSSVRRGAVYEYGHVLRKVPQLLEGSGITSRSLRPTGEAQTNMLALEMWREAESLVLQPHSFTALRQLPELQQIISHTAVAAVTACAGQMTHMKVLHQAERQGREQLSYSNLNMTAESWRDSKAIKEWQKEQLSGSVDLFDHLAPALRLCLAAEVAVGMLCPSQPAPPDTPEHAAALHMFVTEAYRHAAHELIEDDDMADDNIYNAAAAVEKLWQHLDEQPMQKDQQNQQRQQQQQGAPAVVPPRDGDLSQWLLSPHVDLQMHLPPHQLLLLLLQLYQMGIQQEQQQQQQGQQEVQQGEQQQQQGFTNAHAEPRLCNGGSAAEPTAAAAGAAAAEQQLETLPVDVHSLHENYLRQIVDMAGPDLQLGAAVVAALQQNNSSSSSRSDASGTADSSSSSSDSNTKAAAAAQHPAEALLQLCMAVHGGIDAQQQQNQQQGQQADHQHQQQGSGCTAEDGKAVAAALLEHAMLDAAAAAGSAAAAAGANAHQACEAAVSSEQQTGSSSSTSSRTAVLSPAAADKLMTDVDLLVRGLMAQFVYDQWHAAAAAGSSGADVWQQSVPLQTLLLHQQALYVSQLALQSYQLYETDNLKPCGNRENGDWASSSSSDSSDSESCSGALPSDAVSTDSKAQQEQSLMQLLQQVLVLLHLIRRFRSANAELIKTPAAAAAAKSGSIGSSRDGARHTNNAGGSSNMQVGSSNIATAANSHTGSSSSSYTGSRLVNSSSSSSESVQLMDPATFFSSNGPLARGTCGLWPSSSCGSSSSVNTCSIDASSNSSVPEPDSSSPNDKQQQQQEQQLLLWQVFLGCCCWQQASTTADLALSHELQHSQQALGQEILDTMMNNIINEVVQQKRPSSEVMKKINSFMRLFREQGFSLPACNMQQLLLEAINIAPAAQKVLQDIRCESLKQQGYDVAAWQQWQQHKEATTDAAYQMLGSVTRQVGDVLIIDGHSMSDEQAEEMMHELRKLNNRMEDDWVTDSISNNVSNSVKDVKSNNVDNNIKGVHSSSMTGTGNDGSVAGDSTKAGLPVPASSSSSSIADDSTQAGRPAQASSSSGSSSSGSSSNATDRNDAQASSSGSSLSAKWNVQTELDKAHRAYRRLGGAIGQLFTPLYLWHQQWLQQHNQQMEQAKHWSEGDRLKVAAQGAVQLNRSAYYSAGSSSSIAERFQQRSPHDHHKQCPLCHSEQQQQQQQQQGQGGKPPPPPPSAAAAPGANPFTSPAVSYADPFLWRRLLWQLLGKLSPAAQAFYVQYFAMCAHTTDDSLWASVSYSIHQSLWSPPTGDVIELQLTAVSHISRSDNSQRLVRVKQYATALNEAYTQVQCPAAVVLAKQVLLSLSPLHHCVVPHPSLTHYLPSSNTAAAGKCLQLQLLGGSSGGRDVMDSFSREGCEVLPWHVYWHMGIRRYHQLKSKQQQQQQQWALGSNGLMAAAASSGSSSGSGSAEHLYNDPDARLYAVGFATRQLAAIKPQHTTDQAPAADRLATLSQNTQTQAARLIEQVRDVHMFERMTQNDPQLQQLKESGYSVPDNTAAQDALLNMHRISAQVGAILQYDDTAAAFTVTNEPTDVLASQQSAQQQQFLDLQTSRGMFIARFYLSDSEVKTAAAAAVARNRPNAAAAWQQYKSRSDVEQLMLQMPVPVDAFVDQRVWCEGQQLLLELNSLCDGCRKSCRSKFMFTCLDCQVPVYCSQECSEKAYKHHKTMCDKLQAARQRYAPGWLADHDDKTLTANPSTPQQQQQHPVAFRRLLSLLDPLPDDDWPQRSNWEVLTSLPAGVITPDLFLYEAGRLFEQRHKLSISDEALQVARSASRVQPGRTDELDQLMA